MSTANPTTKKCLRGHEYTPANRYASPRQPNKTRCVVCFRERARRVYVKSPKVPLPLAEAFYSHVKIDDRSVCWPWLGAPDKNGYGRLKHGGKMSKAHRISYELNVGPIPKGLTIDHVKARGCLLKSCVNPSHLEPVTVGVNVLRGDAPSAKFARSERCPRGHEYSRRANGSQRICRTCIRASEARYREARRANRG